MEVEWELTISDIPENPEYPIKSFRISDFGVRTGPFYHRVSDIIEALSQTSDLFHDAEGEKEDEIPTPVLPVGTIRYSTNPSRTKHRVTMVLDKKMWDIRYGDDPELLSIGFPRMILQYLVVPNHETFRIVEMRIYAILDDKKPITDDTPLFVFPYPNVGKYNGIVCWGQNERLEIRSLSELERAFFWFVSAPFNEDHGVRTTLGINTARLLFEKIKDQMFDDDWLIPANRTFGDLFKKI